MKLNPAIGFAALSALPELGPTGPATEFRIFPWGKHTSEKGTYLFDKQSAASVMQAFARKGRDIALDYEHGMVKPDKELPTDGPVPAAGWFSIEVRGDGTKPEEDGLWAVKVKWTPRALAYLTAKEYRFYSPAFLYDPKSNRVQELVNVALTNTPAQHNMTPLIAASEDPAVPPEPKTMKTLLAALSMSETSTEADLLARFTSIQTESTKRHDELQKLVALTGKTTVAEATGVIEGLKVALETSKAQSEELKKLKAEGRARQVNALVKQGMDAKKITPAQKEKFLEMGRQKGGVKLLKAFLETATPVVGKSAGRGKAGDAPDVEALIATLTADEKKIIVDGGISVEDYAKNKAKHQAAQLAAH